METFISLYIITLVIPVLMILVGNIIKKKSSKNKDSKIAYRTRRNERNEDIWKYSQEKCGKIWIIIGSIMLIITSIVELPMIKAGDRVIGTIVLVIMTMQIVMLIVSLIQVEQEINKEFDEEGNRKDREK